MVVVEIADHERQQQTQEQQDFDDGIHQLVNAIRRPSKTDDENTLAILQSLLEKLIQLCGDDTNRWKTLVLAITHKRYHLLSPQAKQESSTDAGDGERLVFYTAIYTIFGHVQKSPQAKLALESLVKIAPLAGGSRDVCSVIEGMVSSLALQDEGMKQVRTVMLELKGKESLSPLVAYGVCMIQDKLQQQDDSSGLSALKLLLTLAADTLDQDLAIIRSYDESDNKKKEKELPSTLHMFVPHRDRGKSNKKKKTANQENQQEATTKIATVSDRQVVNGIAEILIWCRTVQAVENKAFMDCYESLVKLAKNRYTITDDATATKFKSNLHVMQTIIRNLRKELNGFARKQGFMLTDQFQLKSADALTLTQVARGKAGDLTTLTRLAKKKGDTNVLNLIRTRGELGKVDKYASVTDLMKMAVEAKESPELLQELHLTRVKATLEHLRGLVSKTQDKSVVVSSMENSNSNHVTAILVAAAMSKWEVSTDEDAEMDTEKVEETATAESAMETEETPKKTVEDAVMDMEVSSESKETVKVQEDTVVKLFIAGAEKEMGSFQDFMALLNDAAHGLFKNDSDAPSFMDQDGIATTKAVMNTIDRHLEESQAMLLITSADIRLPSDFMKALTARGCTVHCHDSDGIGARLSRENAQKGDITISLAWDTTDDLDLHVIIPNGEEISYSRKNSRTLPCMLDVDMNVGGGSREPVENVFAGNLDEMVQAPQGKYKVIVQNFAYHEPGAHTSQPPVPFRVVVEKNGVKEKFQGQCQGTGSRSNVVVHEFTYEGRKIPFPTEEKYLSAFSTSNMVNLTASTGQTLESLGRLVKTIQELDHLDAVRMLVDEEGEEEGSMAERSLVAEQGTLDVTNRDRINMILAKLPQRFHLIVGEAFGGPSLVETCAMEISRRMVADNIPITELKRAGYPDDIVKAVKEQMGKTNPV